MKNIMMFLTIFLNGSINSRIAVSLKCSSTQANGEVGGNWKVGGMMTGVK